MACRRASWKILLNRAIFVRNNSQNSLQTEKYRNLWANVLDLRTEGRGNGRVGRTSDSGLPVVYSQTHFTPNAIIAIENASTVTVQPRVTYKASFSRKSIQICTSTRALECKLSRFFVEICFYFSLYHCQCKILSILFRFCEHLAVCP